MGLGRKNLLDKIRRENFPNHFDDNTIDVLQRIEDHQTVIGIIFVRNNQIQLSSMPVTMTQKLGASLPKVATLFKQAVTELDVFDELVAFRIETPQFEVLVATGDEFCACVVNKLKKKPKQRK